MSQRIKATTPSIFPVSLLNPNSPPSYPLFPKFLAKLRTVKAKQTQPYADRFIYINSVLASPIYYMTNIPPAKNLLRQKELLYETLLVGMNPRWKSNKPVHFRATVALCQPKKEGGLGSRDLHSDPLTPHTGLLIHSVWMVVSNKDPPSMGRSQSKILSKQFQNYPNVSFCKMSIHDPKSIWTQPWC